MDVTFINLKYASTGREETNNLFHKIGLENTKFYLVKIKSKKSKEERVKLYVYSI